MYMCLSNSYLPFNFLSYPFLEIMESSKQSQKISQAQIYILFQEPPRFILQFYKTGQHLSNPAIWSKTR